jgi:hypothetical protein
MNLSQIRSQIELKAINWRIIHLMENALVTIF